MAKDDQHGPGNEQGRGHCGRKATPARDWSLVTCADCLAALRADHAAGLPTPRPKRD